MTDRQIRQYRQTDRQTDRPDSEMMKEMNERLSDWNDGSIGSGRSVHYGPSAAAANDACRSFLQAQLI